MTEKEIKLQLEDMVTNIIKINNRRTIIIEELKRYKTYVFGLYMFNMIDKDFCNDLITYLNDIINNFEVV